MPREVQQTSQFVISSTGSVEIRVRVPRQTARKSTVTIVSFKKLLSMILMLVIIACILSLTIRLGLPEIHRQTVCCHRVIYLWPVRVPHPRLLLFVVIMTMKINQLLVLQLH